MSGISIVCFIISAHSILVAMYVLLDPEWYNNKAYRAGVVPNIKGAIISKLVMALIFGGAGMYFY